MGSSNASSGGDQSLRSIVFLQNSCDVLHSIFRRERVHFAAGVVSILDRSLQEAASGLDGEAVGDGVSGLLFVIGESGKRKAYPDAAAVGEEFDVDSIGVA